MRRQFIRSLCLAAIAATAADAAMAQTGTAGNPGGQLLGEGFFAPSSTSGVGSGAAGSPMNTGKPTNLGLFGPGGFWSDAKPLTSTGSTPSGVELVSAPATTNGTANASAPATATTRTARPSLGGIGPRRFLSPG